MPSRIQRKRTKGYRMPKDAIYVGRPTRWGNPFVVAGEIFREYAMKRMAEDPEWLAPLRGHDLVCWCPLVDREGRPYWKGRCHADVLLELANA